jgi:hypothetical protein
LGESTMMRSPGRAGIALVDPRLGAAGERPEALWGRLVVALVPPTDVFAVVFPAVALLAVVFLGVVLFTGTVCLPTAGASVSLLLRLDERP